MSNPRIYTQEEVERERKKPLSHRMLEAILFVSNIMPESTDWLHVKKMIMLEIPPKERQLFSTRDALTKKHYPFNEFELNVRVEWKRLTGNLLLMPENKMFTDAEDGYE